MTNHFDEAVGTLLGWNNLVQHFDGWQVVNAIEGLTHATLALAHEQRIANLIAMATAQWPSGSAMFPGYSERAKQEILSALDYKEVSA